MIIYIIRHGETRLNKLGRTQGWIDEPLNENGITLAEVTGEALKKIPFDVMFTSPLVRARKTGELVIGPSEEYYGRKIPVIEDSRLMELNWGSWDNEGCTEENFSIPAPMEVFNCLFAAPFAYKGADDGEDIHQICARTKDFMDELIANPEYQDKVILVSTHGCAMRGLLNQFYDDPTDFWHGHCPYNCEVNILGVKEGHPWLIAEEQIYYDESLVFDPYKLVEE